MYLPEPGRMVEGVGWSPLCQTVVKPPLPAPESRTSRRGMGHVPSSDILLPHCGARSKGRWMCCSIGNALRSEARPSESTGRNRTATDLRCSNAHLAVAASGMRYKGPGRWWRNRRSRRQCDRGAESRSSRWCLLLFLCLVSAGKRQRNKE